MISKISDYEHVRVIFLLKHYNPASKTEGQISNYQRVTWKLEIKPMMLKHIKFMFHHHYLIIIMQ